MALSLMVLVLLLNFAIIHADIAEQLLPADYVDFWFIRLLINLFGYATIIVPGYLLIQYFKKHKYDEQHKGE